MSGKRLAKNQMKIAEVFHHRVSGWQRFRNNCAAFKHKCKRKVEGNGVGVCICDCVCVCVHLIIGVK